MGTRHLIRVFDENEELKISQYGQWDGYPEGQGYGILEFLQKEGNLENLKSNLPKCRFFDVENNEEDKKFIDEYEKNAPAWSNEPDKRTEEQKIWWSTYMHRDLGCDILTNIADSKDEEILLQKEEMEEDDIWIEYWYDINLKENTLRVNDLISFDINNLPKKENFKNSIYKAKYGDEWEDE
jgi:hypothetical protein